MTWLWIALGAVAGLGLALLYWQLIVAEATYFGPRAVAKTYDWVAGRYDRIKQFSAWDESHFVAAPLLRALDGVHRPLILDVATGTGRLPVALLRERFAGRIVGLDLSLGMLQRAQAKLRDYGEQVGLVWQDASRLPFPDGVFDAVVSLESLEFFPRPADSLAEMVRVLRPGGVLFVTNRVGREARLLPRRAVPRARFEELLTSLGLSELQVRPWQACYDLATARKEGLTAGEGAADAGLVDLLRCPGCGGPLRGGPAAVSCMECGRSFVIRDGIVLLARA